MQSSGIPILILEGQRYVEVRPWPLTSEPQYSSTDHRPRRFYSAVELVACTGQTDRRTDVTWPARWRASWRSHDRVCMCVCVCVCVCVSAIEYAVSTDNLNLSAIRTVRVLRPIRAINRIPSQCTGYVYISLNLSLFVSLRLCLRVS